MSSIQSKTEDISNTHIVASDLDGTLLLPDHTIGSFTKETLQKLHKQGLTFIFATGRHHVDVANFRDTVGIPAFMITANGARVHAPDNTQLYSKNVPADLVAAVIDVIKEDPEHRIHIYRDNDWLTDKEDIALSKLHEHSVFKNGFFDVNNPPTENVAKVFFTHTDHDHLAIYEARLNEMFGDQLSIAFSTPYYLEIMASNVSKGHALEAVATLLEKDLSHCIAFGDGMNDAEMLSVAHKGFIMGTAHDKLKKALPNNEIIGNCVDEAVAHYLEAHLLK